MNTLRNILTLTTLLMLSVGCGHKHVTEQHVHTVEHRNTDPIYQYQGYDMVWWYLIYHNDHSVSYYRSSSPVSNFSGSTFTTVPADRVPSFTQNLNGLPRSEVHPEPNQEPEIVEQVVEFTEVSEAPTNEPDSSGTATEFTETPANTMESSPGTESSGSLSSDSSSSSSGGDSGGSSE